MIKDLSYMYKIITYKYPQFYVIVTFGNHDIEIKNLTSDVNVGNKLV